MRRLQKLLDERNIKLELDEAARDWLAMEGYDPAYGARPLKRVIQREVADRLASALLEGAVVDGSTVVVDAGPDGLTLTSTPT
jgi:ATP-dependent Clp protease ATP-binding subunit ClpB